MSGNAKEAEKELVSLSQDVPDDERVVHLLAYLRLSQNRLAAAEEVYLRYLERHPQAVESRVNLGLINFKLARTQEAFAHLRKAFELDFEKANPYFYRQLVRNMSPQGLAEVAEDTKRALGLPGDGPRAHLYLAREYQNLTRHDSAIEEYDKYLAEQPEDAEARLALARQYLRTGDRERAETAVGGLLELTGEVGSDARLFAAELAVTDSNIERALRLLEELPGTYKELSSY